MLFVQHAQHESDVLLARREFPQRIAARLQLLRPIDTSRNVTGNKAARLRYGQPVL